MLQSSIEDFKIEKINRFGEEKFAIMARKYVWKWLKFNFVPTDEFELFIEDVSGAQGDDDIVHAYKIEQNAINALQSLRRKYQF